MGFPGISAERRSGGEFDLTDMMGECVARNAWARCGLGLGLCLHLCAVASGMNAVRFSHLMPGVSGIRVTLDGIPVTEVLHFRATTPYRVVKGSTTLLRVSRHDNPDDVICEAHLSFKPQKTYTIALTGAPKQVRPLVLCDSTVGVRGEMKLRFVHVVPDAPAMDITNGEEKEGAAAFVSGLRYRGSVDKIFAAAPTRLVVRHAGSPATILDLGRVQLAEATNFTVFIAGLVGQGTVETLSLVTAQPVPAWIELAHVLPHAPEVNLRLDGVPIHRAVSPATLTEGVPVPPGTYRLEVSSPLWRNLTDTITLVSGLKYTVTTAPLPDDKSAPWVMTADRTSLAGAAKVRFAHADADLPTVDVAVVGGPVLVSALCFAHVSPYLELVPAFTDLQVLDASSGHVLLSLPETQWHAGVNLTIVIGGRDRQGRSTVLTAVDIDDRFSRGDVSRDGRHNIDDLFRILEICFGYPQGPICRDAADLNDDGKITVDDAVWLLRFLMDGRQRPLPPFPVPGTDPSPDQLPCASSR